MRVCACSISPHVICSQEEELRLRREAMVSQQRHEAQMVRRRIEEDKHWMRQRQKDAVYSFVNKVSNNIALLTGSVII